jgi:phospholipid transport system substrate-binding protein
MTNFNKESRNHSTATSSFRVGPCRLARRALAPCIFAATVALSGRIPLAHAATTPAESFVQQSVSKGFGILKDSSLTKQQRAGQFREFLRSTIDFKRIAVFALGPYAHNASDKDVDQFVNAFSDYLLSMFHLDQDQSLGGQSIAVTGSTSRAADDVIVTARIGGAGVTTPTGMPLNLAFRVRKNVAGNEQIVDILLGGVSVAVTQRDEFSSYLQQHGGNVAQLSAELERRVAAG